MHKKNTFWSAALAVSVSLALALPAFAQSQSTGSKMSSPSDTPASAQSQSTGSKMSSPSDTSPSGGSSMQSSQSSKRTATSMEDKAATEADRTLNQRIRQALNGDMTLDTVIQKIHLDTDNGEVTLHGSVGTDKQKTDIASKVQQVAGVKKVENQLQTASN